ncbi:MAG: glycosyltransferase family 39 protein [Anaerolineae bacterium]|jgi:hypothetical protein|nr:glycosyltransferase family 39 protein [Anaerolineae bacterium]
MQQTMTPTETTTSRATPQVWTLSLEGIVYLALIVLALVFRLAEIDSIPLTPAETADALAAWRTISPDGAPVPEEFTTDSPVLFTMQRIGFTLLGPTELAARLLTMLTGLALAFTPLLFRDRLGRTRTLLWVVLLAFSPIALLASRTSSPMIWASLAAVFGIYFFSRFWHTTNTVDGVLTIVAFGLLLLFSEPGGIVLGVILFGAAVIAVMSHPDLMSEGATPLAQVRQLPWVTGIPITILIVSAIATGFLTYTTGLSGIGEALNGFLSGWTQRPPNTPWVYPLFTSIYYEPFLAIFAIVGTFILVRQHTLTLIDRFLIGWVIMGIIASIFFVGASADHALWLTLPLAGLATHALLQCLITVRLPNLWENASEDDDINRLYTVQVGKWIVALVSLGLLMMLALHLQIIARGLLETADVIAFVERLASGGVRELQNSTLWLVITILLFLVSGLLAASVWGNTTTLQGLGLGLLVFMLINGTAAAWSASVFDYDNPAELWHTHATAREAVLMRETMIQLADRETLGHRDLRITVVIDSERGLTRDGVLAWQLRDFRHTTFVETVEAARAAPIVLMPELEASPDLGGAYVGQRIYLTRNWDPGQLRGLDFLAWWFQRQVRETPQPQLTVMLWVRRDIYESAPISGE